MADAVLSNKQFDLDGYVFGAGQPVFIEAEGGFDPGDVESMTQDGTNPLTGSRLFGRDLRAPRSWQWSLHTSSENEEDALAAVAAMGAAWHNDNYRVAGAFARLRYNLAGRTRCVFGRPRRFSIGAPGSAIDQGHLKPMASFDLADDKHYDDEEQVIELGIAPSTPGGFTVPFDAPLVIELPANVPRSGAMTVGGDTSTSPVVEFIGPVTDPILTIGTFQVGLIGTVPEGVTITIDPRPWSMGITGLRDGVTLDRRTRLARALVGPGAYSAVYKGTDLSGTSRCRVRWRNAYNTL